MQRCPSKMGAVPYLDSVKWQQFVMFHEAGAATLKVANAVRTAKVPTADFTLATCATVGLAFQVQ